MKSPKESLPPVDPKNLQEMRQVYIFTKTKIPTSIGVLLNYLRSWTQENRKDQKYKRG